MCVDCHERTMRACCPHQVAFGFGASLHVLGVGISVGPLGLDTSGVPWNDVVDALKDKILEPLTGTNMRVHI